MASMSDLHVSRPPLTSSPPSSDTQGGKPNTEHARYVYNLQESSSASSESEDEESWDSDDSAHSWRRQSTNRTNGGKSSSNGANQQLPTTTTNATTNTANGGSINGNGSRTRMSIITGRYFDVPVHENGFGHFDHGAPLGKAAKRRFFNYSEKWDDVNGGLTTRDALSPLPGSVNLTKLMERGGGRDKDPDIAEDDWDDNVSGMAVDS